MNFAIIETGGKQYKVQEGTTVRIEKIDAEEGDEVTFDKVLMVSEDGEVKVGKPYLDKASVQATVQEQGRAEKKIVFRYKPKKRHRRKKGHRQPFTQIEVTSIK